MSKQAYTMTPRIIASIFKKHGVDMEAARKDLVDDVKRLRKDPSHAIMPEGHPRDNYRMASIMLNQITMELEIDRGNAIHLYMPNAEFCDWLINCVPTLLPEYHQVLDTMFGGRICVLHFPTTSKYRPFMCVTTHKGMGNLGPQDTYEAKHCAVLGEICVQASPSSYLEVVGEFDGSSTDHLSKLFCKDVENSKLCAPSGSAVAKCPDLNGDIDTGAQYIKLVAGIALYVDCFCEALIDGVPNDLKHPSHHAHKVSKTLGIVAKIKQSLGGTHASPTAHYRDGHFRTLRSERYVNKRFQTIWVDGVFVKGRSKTVLTPEAVDAKEETKTFAFGTATENSQDEGSRVLQGRALETAR